MEFFMSAPLSASAKEAEGRITLNRSCSEASNLDFEPRDMCAARPKCDSPESMTSTMMMSEDNFSSDSDNQEAALDQRGSFIADDGAGAGQKLPDDIQDELDRNGVSTEQIPARMLEEMKMLKPAEGAKHQFMPGAVRIPTLHFMQHLAKILQMDFHRWYDCQVLLDATDRLTPGGIPINLLPATAIAVVKLVWKIDNAVQSIQMQGYGDRLSQHAALLTSGLASMGYETTPVNKDLVMEREAAILKALHWQVQLSSVDSWMTMFCVRFNVVTRKLFEPSLDWVSKQSVFFARILVLSEAATESLPPHRQAAGLFALSFVSAKLLPLDLLRPAKVSSKDWEELFIKSQAQQTVPACVLPPGHFQRILKLLEVVTHMKLEAIQEACYLVAEKLYNFMPKAGPGPGAVQQPEFQPAIRTNAMEAMVLAPQHPEAVMQEHAGPGILGETEVHHTTL